MDFSAEVKQHDKFQLEMKFICPFDEQKKVNDGHIEVFFFLPRNLAVNANTYQSADFYKDFTEYVRFKTPSMSLHDLACPDNSAQRRLAAAIGNLPQAEADFVRHLKMFCSIAKSALRDTEAALEELPPGRRTTEVASFAADVAALLANYRALYPDRERFPRAAELFALVDEFLSIAVNGYLFRFWKFLQSSGAAELPECQRIIAGATAAEIRYRKAAGFPSAEADNSELLYRESTLKKAMAGILFLRVAMRKDGVFLENLLLGLCAAVAMVFVTAVSFLWKGLFLEEFSASFFVVWVIAYMFKDRIKSQLQLFCMNRRSRYSYDYRQKIFDDFGREIGVFREGFRYCRTCDLDEKVIRLRNRTALSELENGMLDESVLLYRKKIELFGDAAQGIMKEFSVHGVVNIYRLNIRHWTYKMDNPTRTIYTSDGQEVSPVTANRDYHVNVILRYGESGGPDRYARYRLVICRDGIRRIDRVPVPVQGTSGNMAR